MESSSMIQGRIAANTFRIVIIATFAFSVFAVICRLLASIPQRKRIGLDDIFLIIGTIFLIAGTTLLLIQIDILYLVEGIDLNGLPNPVTTDLIDKIDLFSKLRWSYLAVSWAAIYFVKFSFLAFFSGLCERMRRMDLYRKSLYGLCLLTFIYLASNAILACTHDGADVLQCTTVGALQQNMAMAMAAISLDILTDLTIISIPIILLWKVKLRLYQKIVIGMALCLSIVMIIVAIVRMVGYRYHGVIDNSWIYLWQHVEACTAVTMFSLTAFRSVFTRVALKHDPWNALIPSFIRGTTRVTSSSARNLNKVYIPDPTISGMSATIYGTAYDDDMNYAEQPGIAVTTDYSVHNEKAIRQPEEAL